MKSNNTILNIYDSLYGNYGPQYWWPGDSPFEIVIGAILTQNTNWGNVEKAISNLKSKGVLTPTGLKDIQPHNLAELIRPSGYFNIKTSRLKHFIAYLFSRHDGSLEKMFALELKPLRHELLEVKGIGPETADSILLYAGGYPTFVVDAYTVRIFQRLDLLPEEVTYHQTQEFFMDRLPADIQLFNEYHALIVRLGKECCKPRPNCERCPLMSEFCRLKQKS